MEADGFIPNRALNHPPVLKAAVASNVLQHGFYVLLVSHQDMILKQVLNSGNHMQGLLYRPKLNGASYIVYSKYIPMNSNYFIQIKTGQKHKHPSKHFAATEANLCS